ncbi:MAG: hypothetical protein MZV65_42570 [Chromatiales bacterium]|nr:hypothetical protein [Chromatiales bacterium]
MSDSTWDVRLMLLAHHIAHWSTERGRRVGAVIVGPDHEVRSTGHNGFPRGVNEEIEHRHRPRIRGKVLLEFARGAKRDLQRRAGRRSPQGLHHVRAVVSLW